MRPHRLAAALALGIALLAVPATSPIPAAGAGSLPACRLDDILTVPRDYDSGPVTLVDHILRVGPKYRPPDLVPVSNAGVAGGGSVRRIAIDDLRAMADAAAANGTPLDNVSAYRSYRQQVKLFNLYAKRVGFDEAIKFSARPGHSEHQLGLTIDFVSLGDTGLSSNWNETPTGRWMELNAWKYGWLMSYPKGRKAVACYRFEPWHYRYVGRELAREIHDSRLTIREYLWANFTTVDPTTGEPVATPSVSPSESPMPSASPDPGQTASSSVTPAPPTATPAGASSPSDASPPASLPPSSGVVVLPRIDLPVTAAAILLIAALIALVVSLRLLRRYPRGSRRT